MGFRGGRHPERCRDVHLRLGIAGPGRLAHPRDPGQRYGFYDPSLPTVRRGTTVVWSLVATTQHHTVTDTTGMQLFDSGSLDKGDACDYTFTAAGDYDYYCVFHTNMTGRIHVPVWVGPSTGTRTTTFKLVWASADPAAGYAFDVKVLKPHASIWRLMQSATTARGGTFVPHWGSGVYRFKARLRQLATGTTAGWSPPAADHRPVTGSAVAGRGARSSTTVQSICEPGVPAMKASVFSCACSSVNCTGGDFMK